MNSVALSTFLAAVHTLLQNWTERGAVLESLDLYLLCLGETIKRGYITQFLHPNYEVHFYTYHRVTLLTPLLQHYPLSPLVFRAPFQILVDIPSPSPHIAEDENAALLYTVPNAVTKP